MSTLPKKQLRPEDQRLFSIAMKDRWSKGQLYRHIASAMPVFLYCPLMLPWQIALVRDMMGPVGAEDSARRMTYATLRKHFITMIKYVHRPTVVRTDKEASASGFLVTGLQERDMIKLEEYIGLDDHTLETKGVEIETAEGEKIMVAAHVYVWKGPMGQLEPRHWTPLAFMRGEYMDLTNGDCIHCGVNR